MWTICLGQLTLIRFSVIVSKTKQSTPLCRPRKNSDILRQNVRYRQPRRQSILSSCVGRIPQTNLRFYNVSVRDLIFFDAVTPPLMPIEIVLGQTVLRWTIGWVGYVKTSATPCVAWTKGWHLDGKFTRSLTPWHHGTSHICPNTAVLHGLMGRTNRVAD